MNRQGAKCAKEGKTHGNYVMPNGDNKNWVRLLGSIDGFRVSFNKWPNRVRIFPGSLRKIREDLFTPDSYALITSKVELVADELPMVAEDDEGNQYSYGDQGFPSERPSPSAREWLGVDPDLH